MSGQILHVLAADDDPTVGILLQAVLLPPAFRLHVVTDGLAAQAAGRQIEAIDVALLDVEMPGMDGLQVAADLRAERGKDLCIVLMTGREDEAFLAELARLDAHHLAKPVDWRALPARLREWCA